MSQIDEELKAGLWLGVDYPPGTRFDIQVRGNATFDDAHEEWISLSIPLIRMTPVQRASVVSRMQDRRGLYFGNRCGTEMAFAVVYINGPGVEMRRYIDQLGWVIGQHHDP